MLHFYQVPALEHSVKIQKCTSSGSLCAKLECANSSHSIADEGTFVNTNKSERLGKEVPLSKALIWGSRSTRKMKKQGKIEIVANSDCCKWLSNSDCCAFNHIKKMDNINNHDN